MSLDAFAQLSREHFQRHRQAIYERTDRMFGWVMAIQYILAVVFAFALSPRTWTGGTVAVHPHVWLALFLGATLAAYPILLTTRHPGAKSTRYTVALVQGLFSALLIHLTDGRIETHFHVFGSLAFLAMYRDWRVLAINSAVVALDHAARGAWLPATIYGVSDGAEWRFLEHTGWVLFEDAFLFFGCVLMIREMRGLAERQAELEIANERIERTAAEINRQSAVLNSVLTGMHDGVLVVGLDGDFLHINPAAQTILGAREEGQTAQEWRGQFRFSDEAGEARSVDSLPLVRAMRGESIHGETMQAFHGETGESVWLEVGAEPLLDEDGERAGGVAVFRDVTESRRILEENAFARREAERANRAKSEFLSRMSHELRTPMNAILGFSQILRMDELTEDQEESLDQIVKAGGHLLKLINEVLDLSGIEAGKLTISKEPVDVFDVTNEVVGMVRPLAANANVTVRLADGVTGDVYALADRQRLLQVLLNLVSNGIKYNVPNGAVEIDVEREAGKLRIAVRDTGPGIPEEKRTSLFNPFERLGAQNTAVEGTGLGLALTKRLVEAMGGEIALRPSERGACFVVEFLESLSPLRILQGGGIAQPVALDDADFEGVEVLFIEDNDTNVVLVERIFASLPHARLRVATSGILGLEMARERQPDLVLLDMDLPDMHGQEVLRLMRGDRKLAAVPIVAVSADVNPAQIERTHELGATEYLTKPFDVADILGLVEDLKEGERKVA